MGKARAVLDDKCDGLWDGPTFQTTSHIEGVEVGCVQADECMLVRVMGRPRYSRMNRSERFESEKMLSNTWQRAILSDSTRHQPMLLTRNNSERTFRSKRTGKFHDTCAT